MDINSIGKRVLIVESIHFSCPAVGYAVHTAPLREFL